MDIEEMLDEAIVREFEEMRSVPPEEMSDKIDNLERLYKLRQKDREIEYDFQAKTEATEAKAEADAKKVENEKVNGAINAAVQLAGVVIPALISSIWMGRGFRFEQTGTICSTTAKTLFQNLIRIKK